MNDDRDKRRLFIQKINALFSNIKEWLIGSDLRALSEDIIIEDALGCYSIEKLLINTHSNKQIAQIIPVGALILGANGRVDINGLYDNETIVLLDKGGPSITIDDKQCYLYKAITESGWYWIEDKRDKGHLFNAELFFELLAEISDYESN
jgi:hypothetical protein